MKNQIKRKILLIDDDASLLITLSDFLSFEGYKVITADSGEQGLKMLTHMTPDLIILDMSMPGIGGMGFLKKISSPDGDPNYPVLVLTARANMAEFFSNVEVDGFIAKPCDPGDLLMEVGRIIFLRSGIETEKDKKIVKKKKILIGEDDKQINENLVKLFVAAGYIAESVFKGPEVLEQAIIEQPDIIVIKLLLTGMNADVVVEMLKEIPKTKEIPIVLYNENGSEDDASKYTKAESGIKKFVQGNDANSLLSAVEEVMSNKII